MLKNKNSNGQKPTMAQFLAGQNRSQPTTQQPKLDHAKILIDLLKMIMHPKTTSSQLIQYMQMYPIDPNTYLPSPHSDVQMPLLYHCCSQDHLTEFFNYLISKEVNVGAEMICESDPSKQIELLYYSQPQYIPTLVRKGCHLRPETIGISGEKLLIGANIKKLMTLYKHGAITKVDLLQIIQRPQLIFRILDRLYERSFHLCQQVTATDQFATLMGELMKNYMDVFKLFFKNGVSVNQMENNESFLQKVLNTYFIDLIKLTIEYQPNYDHIDFLHYSNFELSNRQVMSYFYNDANHKLIQEFLKDKIIPDKINVKKITQRKKSKPVEEDNDSAEIETTGEA